MQSNHNMEKAIQMNPMDCLPNNIEDLISACETLTPVDVWMEYLTTLPLSTSREELHALNARFMPAIREYLCMDS
jgi:hypothetical protein